HPVNTAIHAVAAPSVFKSDSKQLDQVLLQSFLVNFVVEQTGYPEEIVELDADLEGDLGIDSIKKAQLFGELGEHFEVNISPDLSLDDFPTLRHVMNFLIENAHPVNTAIHAVAAPSVFKSDSKQLDQVLLQSFLVNFVVEQTGYPEEIVELDVDLEGDLGIDSIKKAQLFGELGEHFEVNISSELSLDDFPTLRHVMNFLVENAQSK
ncbi:MAG: phosphopantetheine-binding protein, partial [Planctomycetaceae bacterium]|nr:phosphopantetheine-binding protein [Planctomycetaceae bacterium]